MRGVNKVIILGRCGKDPEIKSTQGGLTMANLSIATSESWKDKNTGEKVEKTEWHNVTFFGKVADIVRQYVSKGSMVYIEGKLNTTKYQDKETGADRYATKILADVIQLLDSKPKDGGAIAVPVGEAKAHDELNDDIPW